MKIYKDIIQRSDEWFEVKQGKMSASHSTAIGSGGAGLTTYIYEVVAGMYSSGSDENYISADMQRGIDLEPEARVLYSLETGEGVDEVGFIEYNEYVGCSPDGLVRKTGGIEIKCPNNTKFFKLLVNGEKEIDTSYIWQIQMSLLITGRTWWDFVAYNQNFENNLVIIRIFPDEEKFEKIKAGFIKGEQMIKDLINKLQ